MRELARETSETVHLSVLDGVDVVYVDKIDSPQPLLAYSAVGGRAPAYAVATGKALLASRLPTTSSTTATPLKSIQTPRMCPCRCSSKNWLTSVASAMPSTAVSGARA